MDEKEKAQRDFEAFIQYLEEKHGIKIEKLKKALQQHDALEYRADQITTTIIRIIVTAILALIGWAIYRGAIHFIEAIKYAY